MEFPKITKNHYLCGASNETASNLKHDMLDKEANPVRDGLDDKCFIMGFLMFEIHLIQFCKKIWRSIIAEELIAR